MTCDVAEAIGDTNDGAAHAFRHDQSLSSRDADLRRADGDFTLTLHDDEQNVDLSVGVRLYGIACAEHHQIEIQVLCHVAPDWATRMVARQTREVDRGLRPDLLIPHLELWLRGVPHAVARSWQLGVARPARGSREEPSASSIL